MESMMNPLETVLENILGDFLSVLTGVLKTGSKRIKLSRLSSGAVIF